MSNVQIKEIVGFEFVAEVGSKLKLFYKSDEDGLVIVDYHDREKEMAAGDVMVAIIDLPDLLDKLLQLYDKVKPRFNFPDRQPVALPSKGGIKLSRKRRKR